MSFGSIWLEVSWWHTSKEDTDENIYIIQSSFRFTSQKGNQKSLGIVKSGATTNPGEKMLCKVNHCKYGENPGENMFCKVNHCKYGESCTAFSLFFASSWLVCPPLTFKKLFFHPLTCLNWSFLFIYPTFYAVFHLF